MGMGSGSSDLHGVERHAMRRALDLAQRGWGRVHPNPMVGAVLLEGERVVGEGFHAEFGGPHAELAALEACERPAGTTCVVTLEPCAHHGKTAACSAALVAAGVARVVYAVDDPNVEARGGAEHLRAAGVSVERGLLACQAAALNAAFLHAHRRSERPFVALKLAASLDGFLADTAGNARWISGPEARAWVHWLRAGFDAIGVGRRTAMTDNPQLTVRGEVVPRIPPTRVVFGRSTELPKHLTVVATAADVPTIVVGIDPSDHPLVRRSADPPDRPAVPARLAAPSLPAALASLRARGVQSLLVEGGGTLAGLLLDAGVVDRIYWIQAPVRLGGGVAAFGTTTARRLEESERWSVIERRSLGPDTLLVMDREPCSQES